MCFHHIYSQVTKVIGYPQNQWSTTNALLYPNVHFFGCIYITLLLLYFQSLVFALNMSSVHLYCICVQCICICGQCICIVFVGSVFVFVGSVFVLYLWAVVPINWPAHLSSLPTQASIFARSLNLNLQFQRLILSNRKIICKISNRQIIYNQKVTG